MAIDKNELIEQITELFHNSTLSLKTTGVDFPESRLTLETVFVEKENEDTVSTHELLNTIAEDGAANLVEVMVNDMIQLNEGAEDNVEEAEFTEVMEEVED